MSQNTHWKHKMKCIQIKNEVKTINTMRHQTIDKWKGTAAAAGPPGPGGPKPCRCRRPLSFVYGLMSHCIDRFHFVFYLYTFHFMLPMCIRLIFLVIFPFSIFYVSFYISYFSCFIFFPQVHLLVPGTTPVNCVLPLQMEHCHFVPCDVKATGKGLGLIHHKFVNESALISASHET